MDGHVSHLVLELLVFCVDLALTYNPLEGFQINACFGSKFEEPNNQLTKKGEETEWDFSETEKLVSLSIRVNEFIDETCKSNFSYSKAFKETTDNSLP